MLVYWRVLPGSLFPSKVTGLHGCWSDGFTQVLHVCSRDHSGEADRTNGISHKPQEGSPILSWTCKVQWFQNSTSTGVQPFMALPNCWRWGICKSNSVKADQKSHRHSSVTYGSGVHDDQTTLPGLLGILPIHRHINQVVPWNGIGVCLIKVGK